MIGTLILWAVAAVVLMIAVKVTGGDPRGDGGGNTYGRAFGATAVLTILSWGIGQADIWLLSALWPVLWLWALKSIYDFGWLRAIGVWFVIVIVTVIAAIILLPFRLLGAGMQSMLEAIF